MDLIDYVNPLQGTASSHNYSNGNTLPIVSMPFGMNSWTLQTKGRDDRWFFHPEDRHCHGLRLTHQPSPWMGDYGHLLIMPQDGIEILEVENWGSSFKKEGRQMSPDYLNIFLNKDRIDIELAPTERGAVIRLKYEEKENPRLLLSTFTGETYLKIEEAVNRVIGYTRANTGGAPDNFAMYFVLDFDCNFDMDRTGIFNNRSEPTSYIEDKGDALGLNLGLTFWGDKTVNIKIATSFISIEQAIYNLEREIGEKSFSQVREETRNAWQESLGRIEISTKEEEKKKIFYSCLYRTLLFPRIFYEYDEGDNKYHYSPHNGEVYPGPMYTDNGFWDTYRTIYPLFSLLYPSRLNEILDSWVSVYKESGWMPKWVSPGERGSMPGTLIDAVFADAIVKGISGFNTELAYEGLKKHAFNLSQMEGAGRQGLKEYMELGYLPEELYRESVSNTLDYVYGDFCIAQIAKKLGEEEDYKKLMKRGMGYKKLFDPVTGFMRGRNKKGDFKKGFDPIEWGGPYCEGGAWQCSWAVQHDFQGLADLIGGKKKLCEKLETLMTTKPHFKIGTYPFEIHEMSEMAEANFGQCALSNQPSFHIPYIFTAIGFPHRTQYWVREALMRLFTAKEDGFPGDEDNGSLAAWYIFGAMGLYPLCPGTNEYVVGSPLFDKVKLNYENGKNLTIVAENQEDDAPYVQGIYLNQKKYSLLYFTHKQLIDNTSILFQMGKEPAKDKDFTLEELPFSAGYLRPEVNAKRED